MDLTISTANARYAFGQFDRITIDGKAFKLYQETEVGVLFSHDDAQGLCQQFSHEELARLGQANRIRVERNYFAPESARKRLMKPDCAVSALVERPARRASKKDLYTAVMTQMHAEGIYKFTDTAMHANEAQLLLRVLQIAPKELPKGDKFLKKSEDYSEVPSPRTLRRWMAERNQFGMIGHLDAMSSRGHRGNRLSPEVVMLMVKEVQGYLSPERPTIKMIHERVQIAIIERNEEREATGWAPLNAPSYETVRRAVRSLDPFRVELARNGLAAARKKYRPVTTGIAVTRCLQRVEIDEWTVDVQTLLASNGFFALLTNEELVSLGFEMDPKTGKLLKNKAARWTLTAAICCATRCIVGLVLSRSANAEAAVQVLQMVTTNKGAWADAVGALTPWDMHGTPERIVYDGGSAFKSTRFRNAAADLGIDAEMAMNGVPENRGTIERVFKTFATDFAPRLSGHTFSSIMEKGDADPEKRAALNLDDFTFALLRWVIDIYHNTPHGGLDGETPVGAWRRLSALYGVTPPPDAEMMRICFGQERDYRLDKTGITVLGVKYQSEILQHHMRRKAPQDIKVRWHPKDIGEVSVYLGSEWITVPATDAALKGVAAQTWLTAVRQVRNAAPKANRLDNVAVRAAIKAIKTRNDMAMANANLNQEDWSEDRCKREEKNLLAGITFVEPAVPTKAKGTLGQEIPSVGQITGEYDNGNGSAVPPSDVGASASSITFEED